MGGMNVALYVFTVVAARLLGPREYGAFASLMAVLIVVSVLQLGIQATAARRISADPEHVGQIEREVLRLSLRAALGVGGLLLLAAPAIDRLLRLDSLLAAGLLALCAIPVTYLGGQLGVLQGERRWWPVAVLYLASGVFRLVAGGALILWHPTDASAMAGVLVGSAVPVALGVYALRRTRDARAGRRAPRAPPGRQGDPREHADAAGLPGADELRRRAGSHRPLRARCGPLRGGADPDQGDAVPPPVRGRGRLPLDGHRPRAPAGTGTRPDVHPRPRDGRGAGLRVAARAGAGVRRRRRVRRDPRPAVALRRARHGALPAPAARVRRPRTPGHPLGRARVGRRAGGARRRLPAVHRDRPAHLRRRHRLRAVRGAAADQPAPTRAARTAIRQRSEGSAERPAC